MKTDIYITIAGGCAALKKVAHCQRRIDRRHLSRLGYLESMLETITILCNVLVALLFLAVHLRFRSGIKRRSLSGKSYHVWAVFQLLATALFLIVFGVVTVLFCVALDSPHGMNAKIGLGILVILVFGLGVILLWWLPNRFVQIKFKTPGSAA